MDYMNLDVRWFTRKTIKLNHSLRKFWIDRKYPKFVRICEILYDLVPSAED